MGSHNVILPERFLQRGSETGPAQKVVVPEAATGVEETRFPRWTRRRFQIDARTLSRVDAAELLAFIVARNGSTHSFLVSDPTDKTTAVDNVSTPSDTDAVIDATPNAARTFYQMVKQYESAAGPQRTLRRLVPGTVVISDGGTPLVEGLGFAVDHFMGTVLLTSGTTNQLTGGCEYHLKCRFDDESGEALEATIEEGQLCSSEFGIIEDQIEELWEQNGPSVQRDVDRAFPLDERTTSGGGYIDINSGVASWTAVWGHGRSLIRTATVAATTLLPDLTVDFPAGTVVPGGPYFQILNMGTATNTIRELPTGGGAERDILTRPIMQSKSARQFWIDDLGLWRGV